MCIRDSYDTYQPNINSYKIKGSNGFSGSISFMNDFVVGVIIINGQVYEIKSIQDNIYVLFDVNASISESNFSCQTSTENTVFENTNPVSQTGGGGCVEMGIEIDNYTYNQFEEN